MCDALATLAGHVKIDPSTIRSGASLLREPICGAFQTVDEGDNGSLMGAYLHHDPIALEEFIHSGSAANDNGQHDFARRNIEHCKASNSDILADISPGFTYAIPARLVDTRIKTYDSETLMT